MARPPTLGKRGELRNQFYLELRRRPGERIAPAGRSEVNLNAKVHGAKRSAAAARAAKSQGLLQGPERTSSGATVAYSSNPCAKRKQRFSCEGQIV